MTFDDMTQPGNQSVLNNAHLVGLYKQGKSKVTLIGLISSKMPLICFENQLEIFNKQKKKKEKISQGGFG